MPLLIDPYMTVDLRNVFIVAVVVLSQDYCQYDYRIPQQFQSYKFTLLKLLRQNTCVEPVFQPSKHIVDLL